jgi:NADPH:quinone reductase
MLALVSTGSDPLVELRDVPDPEPLSNQALVEVRASSLNRGEVRSLAGGAFAPGAVPGWDVAGVVVRAAADGTGPGEGARVAGVVSDGGGWAQLAAVPTAVLGEVPEAVSFEAASTLPIAGLTAWQGLALAGGLLHKRVCVTGASGGVGRFAIQLATLGAAAHVTAIARSGRRAEGLAELGADAIVPELTHDGERFDVILDSVGGPVLGAALARVAPGGDVVSVGNSTGEPTTFEARDFFAGAHGARLHAYLSHARFKEDRSGARDLRALGEVMAAGRLDPQISLAVSWREAQRAIRALLDREVNGKAVLRID